MLPHARDGVSILLLAFTLASARPLHTEESEHETSASPVSNENLLCPSSMGLEEVNNCSFPSRHGRGRNSCHLNVTIKPEEKYCLKMDDTHNITCKTAGGEGSKTVQCWCHFDEQNLDHRYCHLYTYSQLVYYYIHAKFIVLST